MPSRVIAALAFLLVVAGSCAGATRADVETVATSGSADAGAEPTEESAAATTTSTTAPGPVECVSDLSTDDKIGQTLMVLVSDPLDAAEVVGSGAAGGYALVGNQEEGVGDSIEVVNAAAPLPAFAAGDEEGGSVQRFRNVLGRLPSARELATTQSPEEAAATFGAYAEKMAGLGLTMNLGPVADVGTGAGLADRTFGDDVETVTSYSSALVAANEQAGVVPVVKHWPGLGSGDADPHQGTTTVDDIETLRGRDLVVFDELIAGGVPAIMVSHAVVPGLTDGLPASVSSAAIEDELRGRQGFTGVVMTDSLGMGAVASLYDNPRAAREAIVAGADIALLSGVAFVEDAREQVAAALADGTLTIEQLDASVSRVLRSKGIEGPCPSPETG